MCGFVIFFSVWLLYLTCLKLEHNHLQNRGSDCVVDSPSFGYSPGPRVTKARPGLQCVFARHVGKEIPMSVKMKITIKKQWAFTVDCSTKLTRFYEAAK